MQVSRLNCEAFISAIANSRYPEQKTDIINSTTAKTKPVHDWTSHARTAMEYFVEYILQEEERLIKKDNRPKRLRQFGNPITGEIEYRTF